MTFTEKITFANQALASSFKLALNNKYLWMQYIFVPLVLTIIFGAISVRCFIKKLVIQQGCILFGSLAESLWYIGLIVLWSLFQVALLRKIYALLDRSNMTFKKSFSFGWWFLGQISIVFMFRCVSSIFSGFGQGLFWVSVSILFTLLSSVWYVGTFYVLAIMTEDLSAWWSSFKYSWHIAWNYLLVTLASVILLFVYLICIVCAFALIVGGFAWVLYKIGFVAWFIATILIVLFGIPCALFLFLTLCVSMTYQAFLYRQIQMFEKQSIEELIPPLFD